MKKVILIALVLLVSVAFVTTVFAQEKAKAAPEKAKAAPAKPAVAPEKPAVPEKAAPAPEKAKPKPKAKIPGFVGIVANVDTAAKTIVVKDKEKVVTFDVSNPKFKGYKNLNEVKVGDKVAVAYTKDGTKVTKIAGKPTVAKKAAPKPKKEKAPKVEAAKPEAKPAAPAKPAEPAKKPAPSKK
jgi:cytochrome bd-type quinol oxidase subunit 1